MEWSQAFPPDRQPTLDDMAAFVASPLWGELRTYLESAYGVAPLVEHSRCGAQPGWNVKYRKSSKALTTLYPMDGYFIALCTVGPKLEPAFELLKPALSPYVQQLYDKQPSSAMGRWLMIDVKDERTLGEVKELVKLRVPPKARQQRP